MSSSCSVDTPEGIVVMMPIIPRVVHLFPFFMAKLQGGIPAGALDVTDVGQSSYKKKKKYECYYQQCIVIEVKVPLKNHHEITFMADCAK